MKTRSCLGLVVFAASLLFASPLHADTYKVDPIHSSVVFRIAHLSTSFLYGRFDEITGTFTLDSDPAKNSFDFTIPVDKIDTNFARRDSDLKGPDFFSAREFPNITFKSTQVSKVDDTHFNVTGDLTIHGVTKSVTISVEKIGQADTPMGPRGGVEAIFTVKRSDFGMTFDKGIVGDEAKLMVGVEGVKQ